MTLVQREEYNQKPKTCLGVARYPDIPEATEFWTGCRYEVPETIFGWEWSTTFGKWSALVQFKGGWPGFTYPKPS